MSKDEILEAIKQMSVLDLSDLVKALEEEFGIKAAAAMSVAAAPTAADPAAGTAGTAAPEEEEQVEFAVLLQDFGSNKINVIKAVRELTSLGLREAKELVESAPTRVKEGIPKETANQMKGKLEEAGATASIE
jgi:large subunit ribosomal protein L7/L12